MESKNYSDYSLQELYDLYNSIDKKTNPIEARDLVQYITQREREGMGTGPERISTDNLASLGERLGASIVDGFILVIPVMTLLVVSFGFSGMIEKFTKERFISQLYMMGGVLILYSIVNLWFLYKNGQTVGKKFLGIKIVDLDNNKPGLGRLFGLRYLVPALINWIPFIGGIFGLVNILFIFRKDRRCIHDHIAGTKVVVAE